MSPSPSDRLEAALASDDPAGSLVLLATALRDEGMAQRDMYDLFDRKRAAHHGDEDEARYDAILDVMDLIVGWCGRRSRLFGTDLTT